MLGSVFKIFSICGGCGKGCPPTPPTGPEGGGGGSGPHRSRVVQTDRGGGVPGTPEKAKKWHFRRLEATKKNCQNAKRIPTKHWKEKKCPILRSENFLHEVGPDPFLPLFFPLQNCSLVSPPFFHTAHGRPSPGLQKCFTGSLPPPPGKRAAIFSKEAVSAWRQWRQRRWDILLRSFFGGGIDIDKFLLDSFGRVGLTPDSQMLG